MSAHGRHDTRYKDFVLLLQPISNDPKAIWFQSDEPISWPEARDRIIATGVTRGFKIGGHGKGMYMISVNRDEIERHRRAGREPVRL